MARDIKFRAWFRPTDEYKADCVDRYGEELPDLEVEYYTEEAFLDDSWVNIDDYEQPIVFEQYTGLKDKNGKEIYEGDIVEYDWYIIGDKPAYRVNSVVNFDYKGAMAGNNRLWKCTNIEVIGNIHENPELLEGEKDG